MMQNMLVWPKHSLHPSKSFMILISLTLLLITTEEFANYHYFPWKNYKVQCEFFWTLLPWLLFIKITIYLSWTYLFFSKKWDRYENGAMVWGILFCQASKSLGQSDILWSSSVAMLTCLIIWEILDLQRHPVKDSNETISVEKSSFLMKQRESCCNIISLKWERITVNPALSLSSTILMVDFLFRILVHRNAVCGCKSWLLFFLFFWCI